MLKVKSLSVSYGEKILENVSFDFGKKGIYTLNAPSGRGKTTFLNAVAGLIEYTGEIEKEGKIAYLFQEDRLLDWYTAEKNIKLTAQNSETADYYIRAFGIDEFKDKYPAQMSGGMKRRCAIARCFAFGGDIYLLDEPFRGLDEENADKVIEEIKKIDGLVLVVTHNGEDTVKLNAKQADLFK